MVILSGDIGGTTARMRLTRLKNGKKHVLAEKAYRSNNYDNALQAIHTFLAEYDYNTLDINSICLGVAGPVENGKVRLSNLKWSIDTKKLKKALKVSNAWLLNDFEAVGYGIETLTNNELHPLQKGISDECGLKVFIGAGTGLGMGFSLWQDRQYTVCPSEIAHANFTPADDLQIDILKFLLKKHPHVSEEHLLSGHGIVNIYSYFREINPYNYKENKQLKKLLLNNHADMTKIIIEFALQHPHDKITSKVLETFVDIYGSKSRDIALTLLPHAGLYLVGNIAANILTKPAYSKKFLCAFNNKQEVKFGKNTRLARVLKNIPIWLVLNPAIGLQGAESYAFKQLGAS